ncbi:MAG: extracellular solute-binding protein, partial [Puniceicoccales bacterium]|nr:extracellular solute-binding protein [Puniceicoccales bacterium]
MFEAKKFLIVILVAAVVGVPFVFREKNSSVIPVHGVETLVVITPHNESLRREYGAGFKKWYKAKTGKEVNVDWRYHGGGRDVARYVESVYANNFRLHWTENLHREWNSSAAAAFSARSEKMLDGDSLVAEVSREFFKSNVGCGIDIMFGAGLVESEIQASKGNLVPCGLLQERPDLFTDDTIPETFAGSRLWDRVGRWFGSALSSFGIIYNSEAILEDGITFFPRTWDDLGRQEFFGKLAIVDPTKSSSVLKAFDMLTQQKMQECFRGVTCGTDADDSQAKAHEEAAIGQGWLEALKLMQRIIANGRYFTDSATRPVVDVSAGNCLAGIAVDFYGFSEAQHLEDRGGSKRFRFCMPIGGGAPSPDPIGFFRGSQSPQLAKDFIE